MSQKSNREFKKQTVSINETDLFTYYLQRNLWAKGIDYETFVETMKKQGVEVYGTSHSQNAAAETKS